MSTKKIKPWPSATRERALFDRGAHTIVGVDEVDPLNGLISWVSPVAKALIKAHEGDLVSLLTPAGRLELEVLTVTY